ncbi:twin-arginine translocation signal domain-containing protein [Candidatus Pacearchaeota archaeon]|nr:twin-arginine translocation signal domain-containing protein [Candidatus Pacearchaeota archaeon]
MDRRGFLKMLGLAPVALVVVPVLAKEPAMAPYTKTTISCCYGDHVLFNGPNAATDISGLQIFAPEKLIAYSSQDMEYAKYRHDLRIYGTGGYETRRDGMIRHIPINEFLPGVKPLRGAQL